MASKRKKKTSWNKQAGENADKAMRKLMAEIHAQQRAGAGKVEASE